MNPLRGVALLIDGAHELRLVFDINAFCLAEQMLGKETDTILQEVDAMSAATRDGASGAWPVTLLRGLLWAGLQQCQPEIHLAAAGDVIGRVGIGAVRNVVVAGLAAAFGVTVETTEDKEASDPPPPDRPGTG